jgi:hypothetical protein
MATHRTRRLPNRVPLRAALWGAALVGVVALASPAPAAEPAAPAAPAAKQAPAATQAQAPQAPAQRKLTPAERLALRGRYLVVTMACNDCHTPWVMGPKGPEPDMKRMLSGHPAAVAVPAPAPLSAPWAWQGTDTMTAFAGPWGVSYSANLTPDKATGLGSWTEAQFIQAMRTGRHQGNGRAILPPMPWPWMGEMGTGDLKAIFAYLQTIPPVANAVPAPQAPPKPAAPVAR